jgi:hypothetical protein
MIRQKVDSSIILVDQNQNKTRMAFRRNHNDRIISTTKALPPHDPGRYAARPHLFFQIHFSTGFLGGRWEIISADCNPETNALGAGSSGLKGRVSAA